MHHIMTWKTIRISQLNLDWLKEKHKTPNRALDMMRVGTLDPETEFQIINKKIKSLDERLNELENLASQKY